METTADSPVFLDTNILLSATDETRDHHASSTDLLRAPGIPLCASGQVFREYLVVATRPTSVNGLGMTVRDALSNVSRLRRRVALLEENERALGLLTDLVDRHSLRGKRIHDANIAAVAMAHGIDGIVTLNPGDFDFLAGRSGGDKSLRVLAPGEIVDPRG